MNRPGAETGGRMRYTHGIMQLGRQWVFLLFLYVTADYVDPSIPGIFFFDSHTLFVDGVVQVKAHHPETPPAQPLPVPGAGSAEAGASARALPGVRAEHVRTASSHLELHPPPLFLPPPSDAEDH